MKNISDWLRSDDDLCIETVNKKYLLPETTLGHKETIDEFLYRVSGGDKEVEKIIEDLKFIPGGRILSNRGINLYGLKCTYSNCYLVKAPNDNIESIYLTCSKLARTFSYGGGCGVDISKLSPAGARVNNTAKYSSGAVSFINTLSEVSSTIGQNGRRGALMVSIEGSHPDVEKFINLKEDLKVATCANISIKMPDNFFEAVEKDQDWELYFKRGKTGEVISRKVSARDLLHKIAKANHDMGEPGILYWSKVQQYNLMEHEKTYKYGGVNPCGELPLPEGGSCLLGSMNISEYWNNGEFDYKNFSKDVKIAVKYLNEVLEEGLPLHPLREQRDTVSKYMQIGLGVMGVADLFIKAKVKYGSQESLDLLDKVGYALAFSAIDESCVLAEKFGSFLNCDPKKIIESEFFVNNITNNPFVDEKEKNNLIKRVSKYGLRNTQLLTCAPTGTTSTMLGVSSGIEPIFALKINRTTKSLYKTDKEYVVYPKAVKEYFKENNVPVDVDNLPDYFVTSRQIDWKARLDVQGTLQYHIDSAISGTVNLPESATVEDIEKLYMYGYKRGLKGITVFRENCKRGAVLKDVSKEEKSETTTQITTTKPVNILTRAELGDVLPGNIYYKRVACGHIYITISRRNGKPVEVFMQSSKSGGCSANTEALGRLASTLLRSGIDSEQVVDSVIGVKCAACSALKGKGEIIDGLSCSDVMARVIRQEYQNYKNGLYDNEITDKSDEDISPNAQIDNKEDMVSSTDDTSDWDYTKHSVIENVNKGVCPECGSSLVHSEGCIKCINCYFSKC